jgi:ATP-dependent RNA helicase DDX24/MAK5
MSLIEFERKVAIIDLTGPQHFVVDTLKESKIFCLSEEKDIFLYYFLWKYPGRTLIFVNSIDCIRRLVSILRLLQLNVWAIHANMQQKQRFKNLER